MAEPRKPRVIKTRPGATPPPAPAQPRAGGIPSGDQELRGRPAAGAPAADPAGAVRGTSSKVSVAPVPTGGEPAPAGEKPVRGGTTPAPPAPTTGRAGAPGRAKAGRPAAPGTSVPAPSGHAAAGTPGSDHGAESGAQVLAFPLPAHKRRRRNIVYGAAGVVVLLALLMSLALFSPALAVKTVVFEGRKLVAEQTLQAAVAPIIGTPLPQVSEAEVQALLGQVVQVKSSFIEARPPSTLVVRVVERVPVALLKNGDDYLLVDQDGVELGSTKDPASVALPLIDGGKAAIGQTTFNAMTAVLANLPQSILERLANATAASPDAVELKLVDGRSVIWGDASDMELKAQVLEALLNAPPPTAPPGKPEPAPVNVFDVSAPRHPVTR